MDVGDGVCKEKDVKTAIWVLLEHLFPGTFKRIAPGKFFAGIEKSPYFGFFIEGGVWKRVFMAVASPTRSGSTVRFNLPGRAEAGGEHFKKYYRDEFGVKVTSKQREEKNINSTSRVFQYGIIICPEQSKVYLIDIEAIYKLAKTQHVNLDKIPLATKNLLGKKEIKEIKEEHLRHWRTRQSMK